MTPDAASPASDRLVTTISFAFLAAANASGSPAVTYETSASVRRSQGKGSVPRGSNRSPSVTIVRSLP